LQRFDLNARLSVKEETVLEELRAEAMAVATGNDVERIASAVELIDLIDSLT